MFCLRKRRGVERRRISLTCRACLTAGPFLEWKKKMKLVSISPTLLAAYTVDQEVLQKSGRPYVLVIRLTYRGKKQDFAVPVRSNIPAAAPKDQYFALPPRPTTRPKNRHGLQYQLLRSQSQGRDPDGEITRLPMRTPRLRRPLSRSGWNGMKRIPVFCCNSGGNII